MAEPLFVIEGEDPTGARPAVRAEVHPPTISRDAPDFRCRIVWSGLLTGERFAIGINRDQAISLAEAYARSLMTHHGYTSFRRDDVARKPEDPAGGGKAR